MNQKIKWSISTINMLRRCHRQYYFAHLLANHGFKNPLRRRAYELKQMKNLRMWKGTVVEKAIQRYVIDHLNNGIPINQEQVMSEAIALAERQFEFSASGKYKDASLSKNSVGDDYCILDIHENNLPLDPQELESIYADIKKSLHNFFMTSFDDGTSILEFLQTASWRQANINTISFKLENIVVKPQIDLFLYRDNKPVVIDWKVSDRASSDYSRQLIICGIAVKHSNDKKGKKYNFNDIQLYEINLLRGTIKGHLFTKERINEVIDYIYQTAGDIEILVKERSVKNIDMNEFDLTENAGTCAMCNFRSLCQETLIQNPISHEKIFSQLQLFQNQ